jgi:hypothetical protein
MMNTWIFGLLRLLYHQFLKHIFPLRIFSFSTIGPKKNLRLYSFNIGPSTKVFLLFYPKTTQQQQKIICFSLFCVKSSCTKSFFSPFFTYFMDMKIFFHTLSFLDSCVLSCSSAATFHFV